MNLNPTNDRKTTKPVKRQRKPKAKLPPQFAHEMDVIRAATMGIDISYMAPGERCKYPSKFCCNMRARKSTGKLHRLCEFHRSRAKVNQKRWIDLRRQHSHSEEMVEAAVAVGREVLDTGRSWTSLVEAETGAASYASPLRSNERGLMLPIAPENASTVAGVTDHELDALIDELTHGEQVSLDDAWYVSAPWTWEAESTPMYTV